VSAIAVTRDDYVREARLDLAPWMKPVIGGASIGAAGAF
jgi:hypothetical protein